VARSQAKIERYKPCRVGDITTRERARLDCGCTVYVGRTEAMEAATRASACCQEHTVLTDMFNALLTNALAEPARGRELVVTCAKLLTKAAREVG
jgi:hypothetical protein